MAQRDLDAALQLLADRAQFITGASGAAIALRREGMKDMLCRASTGSNAPELGARLSTEFGLSGESVRTKQLLRCDDAERDERVNRDVCRQLGIASVVVMPVVHDDQVLGVFELFSGKTNAFGERDLSAVQRLGSMVETAVRMAQVTERLPETLQADPSPLAQPEPVVPHQEVDEEILDLEADDSPVDAHAVLDASKQSPQTNLLEPHPDAAKAIPGAPTTSSLAATNETVDKPSVQVAHFSPNLGHTAHPFDISPPRKPLLWSAAETEINTDRPADLDQSHVPPVLRGLRKCEACGFPISGGRVLCVECEEKKWRGQLKRSQAMPTGAIPGNSAEKPRALAAAAPDMAGRFPTAPAINAPAQNSAFAMKPSESVNSRKQALSVPAAPGLKQSEETSPQASPNFVLSSALEDRPSWISANRYVLGALVLVAVLVSAFFLSR
jgi:hypothetical protein